MIAEWETDRYQSRGMTLGRAQRRYLIRLRHIPADTHLKEGGEYVFEVNGRRGVKSVLARVDRLTPVYDRVNGRVEITGYFGIARPVKRGRS